jgi:putative transposase
VARAHARVADARQDFPDQASTRPARDNQAITAEALNVKGLARTRMATSARDAGRGTFPATPAHKATRYEGKHRRDLARTDRMFPPSRPRSDRGHRDGPKPLHVRAWTRPHRRTVHDRDRNAARDEPHEGRRIRAAANTPPPPAATKPRAA